MKKEVSVRVMEILTRSNQEALDLKHNSVGVEHLLLSLLNFPDELAVKILISLGVNLDKLKAEIVKEIIPNKAVEPTAELKELSRNANVEKVLKGMPFEAQPYKTKEIYPEHLLLSILRYVRTTNRVLGRFSIDYRTYKIQMNDIYNEMEYEVIEKGDVGEGNQIKPRYIELLRLQWEHKQEQQEQRQKQREEELKLREEQLKQKNELLDRQEEELLKKYPEELKKQRKRKEEELSRRLKKLEENRKEKREKRIEREKQQKQRREEILRKQQQRQAYKFEKQHRKGGAKSRTPTLDQFCLDITELAKEGELSPIVGREKEIERVFQILNRENKRNPVLVGATGVGKTTIVEGLASLIVRRKAPRPLLKKRILKLDLLGLPKLKKDGEELVECVKRIIKELVMSKDIIFIDEIYAITNPMYVTSSLFDLIAMLKSALMKEEIRCIVTSTPEQYNEYVEKGKGLSHCFIKVMVYPPTIEETLHVLRSAKSKHEKFHHVSYTEAAIKACVRYSNRMETGFSQPEKAIDLLDEVGASVGLKRNYEPKFFAELKEKIEKIRAAKTESIKNQQYEKVANLRDDEAKLIHELKFAEAQWEEEVKSKRYQVTEEDVVECLKSLGK